MLDAFFPYCAQYYRTPNPPERDWERDLREMKAQGMNTVRLWAMWSWIHTSEGQADPDALLVSHGLPNTIGGMATMLTDDWRNAAEVDIYGLVLPSVVQLRQRRNVQGSRPNPRCFGRQDVLDGGEPGRTIGGGPDAQPSVGARGYPDLEDDDRAGERRAHRGYVESGGRLISEACPALFGDGGHAQTVNPGFGLHECGGSTLVFILNLTSDDKHLEVSLSGCDGVLEASDVVSGRTIEVTGGSLTTTISGRDAKLLRLPRFSLRTTDRPEAETVRLAADI